MDEKRSTKRSDFETELLRFIATRNKYEVWKLSSQTKIFLVLVVTL
jgi:hypothetical protein